MKLALHQKSAIILYLTGIMITTGGILPSKATSATSSC